MSNEKNRNKPDKNNVRSGWLSWFTSWLFNNTPTIPRPTEPSEVLYRSCHITSKCRYNASIRLAKIGSFSFLTATILSLGLIFIPVIQLSDIPLAYPERVLNGLQIFFAVSVLTYSVINSTAHYELRANALNECGDKLKDLSRRLRSEMYHARSKNITLDLDSMNEMYSRISSASENHSRGDYAQAMLQAEDLYNITGLPRLWLTLKVLYGNFESYSFPIILILAEFVIILDILGITQILTGIFTLPK